MLNVRRLKAHHFFDENVREALVLQTSLYLIYKHEFTKTNAVEAAEKYINTIKEKLDLHIYNADMENVDRLINKYNNRRHKDYLLFAEMVALSTNERLSNRFSKIIVANIENKKQARGLITLLLDNDMANTSSNRNANVYEALYKFDETKPNQSKKNILKSFEEPAYENINKVIDESKTIKSYPNKLSYMINELGNMILDKLLPESVQYIYHKLNRIVKFIGELTKIVYQVGSWLPKKINKDVVECCNELAYRREAKNKRNLKLKLKPNHLREVRG